MRAAITAAVLGVALLAACDAEPPSGTPCTRWDDGDRISLATVDELDLLVVVDDSSAAGAVDLALRHLPRLLADLLSGDHDHDGTRDGARVRSIHVGVVTSDVGVEGHSVAGCEGAGDAGALRSTGAALPECAASYPPFHVIEPGGRAPAEVVADLACLDGIRSGGCRFARLLDAMDRALEPAAHPGFLREGAVLGVLVVTNEDDCSAADASLYDLDDPSLGEPELRCGAHEELLQPLERYLAGLLVDRYRANELVFGALVGVPLDALGRTPEDILAHPDMQRRVDPALPTRFAPSCSSPEIGIAYPPRRIVELAQRFGREGAGIALGSVCASDYERTLAPFARALRGHVGGACLPSGLGTGVRWPYEGCELFEVLPEGRRCEELAGRAWFRDERVGGIERDVCLLRELDHGEALAGEAGWYHEESSDPLPGSSIREDCGSSGHRLVLIGTDPVHRAEHRVACPLSIGPDGGPCE